MVGEDNNIIDEGKINLILNDSKKEYSQKKVDSIIKKALRLNGLTLEETAILLHTEKKTELKKIFDSAKKIKRNIYGNRIVFFLPLYISNECINNCLYCGFRKDNKGIERKTLSLKDIEQEVKEIVKKGHKRILLVAGEGKANVDYVCDAIKKVYSVKKGGEIRRINVNMAPLSISDFRKLKKAGIGTYQIFQETYHRPTYKKMHSSGPKSNYNSRISAVERAYAAGIDDVGIGALFGLYDYKFEVLALLSHANYLDKRYGVGPHTISVPRIEPANGSEYSKAPTYPVSDDDFKKIIAVLRIAVPYTGIILSTRESPTMREECFSLGVSQISAESKTTPGGYNKIEKDNGQFITNDKRPTNELMEYLINNGQIPSFCTACYRVGRTGDSFMKLAKKGTIQNFCHANALFTLKEYLEDYADNDLKKKGEEIIRKEIENINNKKVRKKTADMLKKIEFGKRDVFV